MCIYVFMYLSSFYLVVLAGRCKRMSKVLILRAAPGIPFLTSGSHFRFSTESFRHEPDFLLSLLSSVVF